MAAWDRERVAAWALPALNLAVLLLFFALDVHDLHFKTVWLGPYKSFNFNAAGGATYETTPLVPATSLNVSSLHKGDDVEFTSGWPSFLATCDALYAPPGFFLTARATNCRLGSPSKPVVVNDIYIEADLRVDAVAWAACKLLYLHRRPPICQENIVSEFFQRYRLNDIALTADAMAEPNSDAEQELLQLTELISRSYPLSSVVCVEGIQYGGPGAYPSATIFGCASPNLFDAAFVGLHAPAFAQLQRNLAWLTVDVLNILGFEFVIRQDSTSTFMASTNDLDGRVTLAHHTSMNFSSFGHFYILMIAIDLVLLGVHMRSALETANVLLIPLLGTTNTDDIKALTTNYSWAILYRSLYRSPPIMVLTVISSVLSWQTQMPNSIVWTWNIGTGGKFHAILSSIRVWMLVMCVIHQLWAVVVAVSETRAYQFAKRTFLSTSEVLVIGVVVAVLEQQPTFAIGGKKYAIEGQRLWDTDSFPGYTAYANSFNEELDYLLSTTAAVLGVVYSPMAIIVGESLLIACIWVGVKLVYFSARRPVNGLVANDDAVTQSASVYARLPLEEMLRAPVRAQSLVRSAFSLEIAAQQQQEEQLYIPPSVYFEFGVILDNDIIRTRRGFFNVIHLKVDVAKYFSPISAGSVSSVASMPSVPANAIPPRRASFFGVAAAASPSPATMARQPPGSASPSLSRSGSGKSITDAILATDLVRPASSSNVDKTESGKEGGSSEGRRSLAESSNSPAARSMRRRKSTTELAALDDGF